ncbi:MAG: hypothetical protein VYA34_14775 [Myxococcota bacterium]|nr:hypothetical protein [Myxococcota bacterium]
MTRLCVWLIEDDKRCIQNVESWCQEYGADLVLFKHPADLFGVLEDSFQVHDLVLMDSDPVIHSADELCRSIIDSGETDKTLIFTMCDTYNANIREMGRLMGTDGWLLRPLNKQSVLQLFEVTQSDINLRFSERKDALFDIKMGKLSIGYDGKNILCSGTMDENSNFERVLSLLPDDTANNIGIDWSGLRNINIQGMLAWRDFVENFDMARHTFMFFRCPIIMLEYYRLMPELFGDNVEIASVHLVVSSHIESECIGALMETNQQRSTKGSYLSIRPQTRELAFGDYLDCFLDLHKPPATTHNMFFEYLLFLHINIRHTLSEFFLTRHTILEQVTQMAARFSSFDRAVRFLGAECQSKPATREEMIDCVTSVYEPIFFNLLAAERVLNCLQFKINPDENCECTRRMLTDLLFEFSGSGFGQARFSLKVNKVAKLEAAYDRSQSQADLDNLVMAVYRAVSQIIGRLTGVINEIGAHVMKLLASYSEVEPFVFAAASALEESVGKVEPATLYQFIHHSLQCWDGTAMDMANAIDTAMTTCLDYEVEMIRIMHSLSSHDELTQVLEHRMVELERICEGADRQEIMDRIRDRAVTILEKKIVSFVFQEFKDAFDDSTSTEMELF